jgi:16S rRNA (cytidine1402-2'-O)-methyltransferase
MISFHGDSSQSRIDEILETLRTGDVAVITDAGMPGVSDPGVALVRAAIEHDLAIESVPGPSAVTTAAALSGLVDAGFLFAGYPPRKTSDRVAFFERTLGTAYPVVLFESPHRIVDSLEDLAGSRPELRIAVCRELTKLHESVIRGTVRDVLERLGDPAPPGEYVIVLSAAEPQGAGDPEAEAERMAQTLIKQGLSSSKVAREVARTCGIARADAYSLVLRLKNGGDDAD